MRIREWVRQWEEKVPLSLQEEWDRSGKQMGDFNRELSGIVVSLDLTMEAITMAKEKGANLILTHHPFLLEMPSNFTEESYKGRLILSCLESQIAVYASHTPFDTVEGGINSLLLEKLHLKEDTDCDFGIGRVGSMPNMSLKDFTVRVKEQLGLSHVIYYGNDDMAVSRIAVVGGSGSSMWREALALGCDVFVTGDIKYHTAWDALSEGLALIDPSHYFSESIALLEMAKIAGEHVVGISYDSYRSPKAL